MVQWLWVQLLNQVIQISHPQETKNEVSFDEVCVQINGGIKFYFVEAIDLLENSMFLLP